MRRTPFDYSESERENTIGSRNFSLIHALIVAFFLFGVAATLMYLGEKFQTKAPAISQSNQFDVEK